MDFFLHDLPKLKSKHIHTLRTKLPERRVMSSTTTQSPISSSQHFADKLLTTEVKEINPKGPSSVYRHLCHAGVNGGTMTCRCR